MKNAFWGALNSLAIFMVLVGAALPSAAFAQDSLAASGGGAGIMVIAILVVAVLIYFVPYLLARNRDTVNKGIIFWVNFFFGWTLIGWCFALLLASTSQTTASRDIERETLRRLRQ